MPYFELAAWAVVQGITAILPIGAAAHLRVLSDVLGWAPPAPVVVAAAHAGTFAALAVVLSRDLWRMAVGCVQSARGRHDSGARLARNWALASAPLLAGGLVLSASTPVDGEEAALAVFAWTSLGFGALLFVADRAGMTIRRIEHMGAGGALLLGTIQILALLPGAGRAGIAVTAARIFGYERSEAARFSFLLAMPVVAALALDGLAGAPLDAIEGEATAAAGLAFLSALAALVFLQGWLRHGRFTAFAAYRALLGAALLGWLSLGAGGA